MGGNMTKQQFYVKMALSSLLRRRSRMFTALLAIAIGATILSGLVTLYYDIPRQMGAEFRSYGANFLLYPSGSGAVMSREDAAAATALLPEGVVGIAPYRYRQVKINEQPFMAAGTELSGARKTSPYWGVEGRWPEADAEALIGEEVANRIRLVPGSVFTLTGTDGGERFERSFTVSGMVKTGGVEEAFIFMSLSDFASLSDAPQTNRDGFDVVECSIRAGREVLEEAASRINTVTENVEARLVRRVTESEGAVLSKLKSLVYLVTVVVLLLTMICVATTMMAVVTERRKEIGLRKALGASNEGLIAEFLGEAVFLGAGGGILGAALGFLFAQGVSMKVFFRAVEFNPLLPPVTVFFAALITTIACLAPVRSAAQVDPALVLRGE
ncbi:ABC transporter permease [Spirochaetia bacterium]|nr:ABC transporter permease [Spirochaetia bacterium]